MDTHEILRQLRALTDEERLQAAERARAVVARAAGDKPSRASFTDVIASKYPAWVGRLTAGLMALVFVAAAMPSLFRLFTAGRDEFTNGINEPAQAALVGVSTFLLAEFLIVLSTISARVYFEGRARLIFVVPVGLGLAVALVGNWVVAQPGDLFGWLETLSPPLAVLFLALIGERLVLDAIERRHAGERAYQAALTDWQAATAEPERSPRWRSAYANALRATLQEANTRGTGATARRELMSALSAAHWRALVGREYAADSWHEVADAEALPVSGVEVIQPAALAEVAVEVPPANFTKPLPVVTSTLAASGNGNGHKAHANGSGH